MKTEYNVNERKRNFLKAHPVMKFNIYNKEIRTPTERIYIYYAACELRQSNSITMLLTF